MVKRDKVCILSFHIQTPKKKEKKRNSKEMQRENIYRWSPAEKQFQKLVPHICEYYSKNTLFCG